MAAPIRPEDLAPHYASFLRDGRILLTGHSHQAWPDVARDGILLAFEDAATHVDDKWGPAMEAADAVRRGVTARFGGRPEEVALGANTHELVGRFLSALDLRGRPHLVTTSGEFHSLHRQLRRLAEEGVEVTFVDKAPVQSLTERVAAAVTERTAAVLLSTVLFETSTVVPHLEAAIEAAHRVGAEVLLDAYHAFNVVPFSIDSLPEPVFVTAGGYKYAQWGEGCCFLRVPAGCTLRPVLTGWFADFAGLERARTPGAAVGYGADGARRFAGSTYDPTSHYRARAVIDFFDREGLTVERLRALSLTQTGRILRALEGREVVTPAEEARRGGFVAVRIANASQVAAELRRRKVFVDSRGDLLRFGPAPYVTDDEIDRAMAIFAEVVDGG